MGFSILGRFSFIWFYWRLFVIVIDDALSKVFVTYKYIILKIKILSRAQAFTSMKADLLQDENGVFAFSSRYHHFLFLLQDCWQRICFSGRNVWSCINRYWKFCWSRILILNANFRFSLLVCLCCTRLVAKTREPCLKSKKLPNLVLENRQIYMHFWYIYTYLDSSRKYMPNSKEMLLTKQSHNERISDRNS